jgi:hypothetical protein
LKVGAEKEIKSVLTDVSFKILKEPLILEFFPTSSRLIFTPFDPTSMPLYKSVLSIFRLTLSWADKNKTPVNAKMETIALAKTTLMAEEFT